MEFWASCLRMTGAAMVIMSVILGALVCIEIALPRQTYPLKSRLRGLLFWSLYIPASVVILRLLQEAWTAVRVAPFVTFRFTEWFGWSGPFKYILSGLSVVLIADFVGYWFHRIQHGPLWRFHAVHHAIEEMHAVGSYDHPADILFGYLLVAIPLSMIPFARADQSVALQLLLAMHLKYTHSSMRLNFGPLRWLFVDNIYHRIHHSVEAHHLGKNYGSITPIWDLVFGTAYFPGKNEWPRTGLADVREPRSIREFLDLPLRLPPLRVERVTGCLPSRRVRSPIRAPLA